MDLNPINKTKRKRTVNKAEWTKEKRKRLRIAGKEYVNAKGKFVAEKEPGPDCRCRRRCYEKVSENTRRKLFKGYYSLKSHDEQNAYLFGLIRKVPIARKRAEGSTRRTCTFNYYIRVGGQETQVCVKALANIHGVGKSKIHILCEKLGQSVLFPRDERGRHSKMPKKVTDDTVELVKRHIYSIIRSDKVCLKALANIHGVGEHKIHILCQKLGQNVLFPRDERGRHSLRPKKVGDETVELAKAHIYSIIRTDRAKDFLKDEKANNGPDVNITQMHKDFLDLYDPEYQEELTFYEQNTFSGHYMMHEGEFREVYPSNAICHGSDTPQSSGSKRKRKVMKDGRPEPLIRQWYYSKIFHDLYTTKEAIALRKKVINWKCSEDFVIQKPTRKQRIPRKLANQQPGQHQYQQKTMKSAQTNTHTSIKINSTSSLTPNCKIEHIQVQNVPLKKKPIQVFQTTQGQDTNMYSIYPMTILQDLSQIDPAQAVNLTPHGQTPLRAIAPGHFQVQPQSANGMNLQALGVNINLAQNYNSGIMGYKFE